MSLLFPINRLAAEAGLPFLFYVFCHALGAGLIVAAIAGLRGQLPRWRANHLRAHLIGGVLGFALPFSVLAFVAAKLPSGIAALLLVLTPVFTYLMALLAGVETLRISSILGLALSLAGIVLIVLPGWAPAGAGMTGWFALALLVPVSFAVLNVTVEISSPPATPPLALATGILLAGAVELLPFVVATGQYRIPGGWGALGAAAWPALAAGIIINAIMWPLFYLIVKRAGGFQFSIMNVVALTGAIVWGILLFDEQHSIQVWAAIALMLAGFVMTVARPGERAKSSP